MLPWLLKGCLLYFFPEKKTTGGTYRSRDAKWGEYGIVTEVSVLSNLCISGCALKDNYYTSFILLFKPNFYSCIGISVIFKSQSGFSITGAGYIFYPV